MAEFVHVYNDGGGIRNVPMREGATRFTTTRVIHRCGIPFWIPAGDGGSNGLSFTGTRGVFTLSAELPVTGASAYLTAGCYIYIPAGAGGLAGGWYWCVMTDATNGEVFANQHVLGSGQPVYHTSPTQLANCTSGRITQGTSEITAVSFILPGGSMGPNGEAVIKLRYISSTGAAQKRYNVKVGTGSPAWVTLAHTTTTSLMQILATIQNMGRQDRQHGPRVSTTAQTDAYDCGTSTTSYAGHVKSENTAVDLSVQFTMYMAATTESIILIPTSFAVDYGA